MGVAFSTINDNRTGNGHKGVIYCAGSHGCYFVYYVNGGAGGGIYNTNFLRMNNSTISNNKTGNGCDEEPFEDCGNGGDGGGMYNTGMITSDNCTLC